MKELKQVLFATMTFKPYAALYFFAFMFFKVITSLFFGIEAISVKVILEMGIAGLILSALQLILFPQQIFKSKKIKGRTAIWAILVSLILAYGYFILDWFVEVPTWIVVILFIMMLIGIAFLWGLLWILDLQDTQLLNRQLQSIKESK